MQTALLPRLPFPRTDSSHGFRDGYSECGEAAQHGDPDLELYDLTVEVTRGKTLPQELDAVHLDLCTASAVIPTSSSQDGLPEAP